MRAAVFFVRFSSYTHHTCVATLGDSQEGADAEHESCEQRCVCVTVCVRTYTRACVSVCARVHVCVRVRTRAYVCCAVCACLYE